MIQIPSVGMFFFLTRNILAFTSKNCAGLRLLPFVSQVKALHLTFAYINTGRLSAKIQKCFGTLTLLNCRIIPKDQSIGVAKSHIYASNNISFFKLCIRKYSKHTKSNCYSLSIVYSCCSVVDEILEEWNRDFSVSHLKLPLEMCVILINSLSQITQRLPPHMRHGEGQTKGFVVGC